MRTGQEADIGEVTGMAVFEVDRDANMTHSMTTFIPLIRKVCTLVPLHYSFSFSSLPIIDSNVHKHHRCLMSSIILIHLDSLY